MDIVVAFVLQFDPSEIIGLAARYGPAQAMTEVGVIWIVTSSHDANTGPTRGSASAASLRYLA
jgi:hypothetical protein